MVSPMQGAKRRSMGFRFGVFSLQSGLEEGEHGRDAGVFSFQASSPILHFGFASRGLTRFALFEDDNSDILLMSTPGCVAALLTWG